jgi:hypothetical protein
MILLIHDSKQGLLENAVYKTAKSLDTEIASFCLGNSIDPAHNRVLLDNVPEQIISRTQTNFYPFLFALPGIYNQ